MRLPRFVLVLAAISLPLIATARIHAQGTTLRVPQDFATIQAAVDAAAPGDQVRVGPGQWCGAVFSKRIDLVGEGGATIVGCPTVIVTAGLRAGFFMPDGGASGTTIRHFTFDGRGVSNTNLDPLAFAVFARNANGIVVEQNTVLGTVQAITNTAGSGWTVSHNDILGLSVFTCDGFCGGGDAIVFQQRTPTDPRATDNTATFNVVTGTIPDNLDDFSMTGVFLIGQDGSVIKNNRISIPDNPVAGGDGYGIEISDTCCGLGVSLLTTINSVVVNNDGRGSEYAVVIDRDAGGGTGNSVGTTLRGNFGVNDINGSAGVVRNRSIHTFVEFP